MAVLQEQNTQTGSKVASLETRETASPAVERATLTLSGLKIVVEFPKSGTKDVLEAFAHFMERGDNQGVYDFFVKVDHEDNWEKAVFASYVYAPLPIAAMGIQGREPTLLHITRKDSGEVHYTTPVVDIVFDGKREVVAKAWCPSVLDSVQMTLTTVMSDLLLKHERFFMHSSGILHRDKAFLFSGKSGAGKTTVVWQSDGRTILSDELVILSAETDGSFVAHGTPYFGSWGQLGADVKAPLHCIHFLEKTPYNRIDSLSRKEAFRRVCQVICYLDPGRQITNKLLGFAEQLIPYCRLLHFQPTKELWSFLSNPALFDKGLSHDFL